MFSAGQKWKGGGQNGLEKKKKNLDPGANITGEMK